MNHGQLLSLSKARCFFGGSKDEFLLRWQNDTLPETNIFTPENGWLEPIQFPFEGGTFSRNRTRSNPSPPKTGRFVDESSLTVTITTCLGSGVPN